MPEGCQRFEGPFGRPGVIRLAAVVPLHDSRDGGLDAQELNGLNGMGLAVREVNSTTTSTSSLSFALFACDTFGDEALATGQVEWAAQQMQLPALLTSGNTITLLAAQSGARRDAGMLVMSPNATGEALSALYQLDRATFRTASPDSLQASVLTQLMTGDERYITKTRIAVIYERGSDRDQFATNVTNRLRDAGRTAEPFSYDPPVDAIELFARVKAKVQLTASVLMGSPPQLRAIITQAASTPGFEVTDGHQWLLTSTAKDPSVLSTSVVANALEGQLGVAPSQATGALGDDFRARYTMAYGVAPSTAASSHDAAFLVMLSAAWNSADQNGPTGQSIAEGLLNVSADGGARYSLSALSWAQAVSALSEKTPIAVDGVTGRLQVDPASGATNLPFEIWRVTDGGFVTVRFATP
jgi:hypothetical protein